MDSSKKMPPPLHQQLVITPPLGLQKKKKDNGKVAGEEDNAMSGERKRLLWRILDVFKAARQSCDLTRFQMPIQFNMPKSQLQLYGESVYCCANDLLGVAANADSPIKRFMKVVAWHISTTRCALFGQVPFNPILGETHHVSCGNLNVLLEQVSHHPPISALYATNQHDKIRLQWWQSPYPCYYGTKVEVKVHGKRELFMDNHNEIYEMTCPNLSIRFFPTLCNEWVGESTIKCTSTNLVANLFFHQKPNFTLQSNTSARISGHVFDVITNTTLFELYGSYNGVVMVKEIETRETSILFDAEISLTKLKSIEVLNQKDVKETESLVVWKEVMERLVKSDWESAQKAKHVIEERQRILSRKRRIEGETWRPKYFDKIDENRWQWNQIGEYVDPSSLVIL